MTTAISPTTRPQPDPEELDLFRQLRAATEAERERLTEALVQRHTGTVRWLAGRYANPGVEVSELVQVGYVGLMLAIQRFDPDRGSDFLAFARPTIQGEIRRYFRDKRRWIRLPRKLQEVKAELRPATDALTHELGRSPTVPELAARLGMDEELVIEALAADDVFSPMSLDAPIRRDDNDELSLADVLGGPDDRLDAVDKRNSVAPLVAALPERERRILHLRYFEDLTQAEIGRRVGVSQMQVSRILTSILADLRTQVFRDSVRRAG
jgi:RNA polymerase sigma-B factor